FRQSGLWSLQSGRKWELPSLGLFVLALLAKETAVVMPLLIFAYARLFDYGERAAQGSSWERSLFAALPYAFLTMIYLGIRLNVLHEISMVVTPVSLLDMALTWPSMLFFYLRHLVWPAGLSILYSVPVLHRPDLVNFALPSLVLACAAI